MMCFLLKDLKMTVNAYLFMWCNRGIEAIVPITEYEDQAKLDMWNILKEEPTGKDPLGDILGAMTMRARFNPDRSYELYAMDCDESITEKDLWGWWDNTPQAAADLTREKGVCIFSHRSRNTENKIKIC